MHSSQFNHVKFTLVDGILFGWPKLKSKRILRPKSIFFFCSDLCKQTHFKEVKLLWNLFSNVLIIYKGTKKENVSVVRCSLKLQVVNGRL